MGEVPTLAFMLLGVAAGIGVLILATWWIDREDDRKRKETNQKNNHR